MKKVFAVATVAAVALLTLAAFAPSASATAEAHKWYVCKYVGPPGSAEVLQTGNNPIFVDENAIDVDPVFIGATFSDAQSHSLVVAGPFIDPVDPEPTCPGQTPPVEEASAVLSLPTCLDPNIRATGTNLGDQDEVTFDVFDNGVFLGSFTVGAGAQGFSALFPVTDSDIITVTLHGSETILASRKIELNCQTPPPPPPPPCPGMIAVGSWYGDPRVNIDLTGEATFVVYGGIQRFSGLRRITKTLACDETFRINRYKVKRGHFLNIRMDGVLIVHVQPPRVH